MTRPLTRHFNQRAAANRDRVRISNLERRITGGAAVTNDWVLAQVGFGAVGPNTDVTAAMTGSVVHQTDDGSVYEVGTAGLVDTIDFLQVGTYLVRAIAKFDAGKTGYAMVDAVIGGPCTNYDYNVDAFAPMSIPDAGGGTDFGKYGGRVVWEQLCVVNDLSAPTGAYLHFNNSSSNSLIAVAGQLQVFRLT